MYNTNVYWPAFVDVHCGNQLVNVSRNHSPNVGLLHATGHKSPTESAGTKRSGACFSIRNLRTTIFNFCFSPVASLVR